MDRLSTLRWHLRWSSAWALVATFGVVGLGAMVVHHRSRQAIVWDHRNAGFDEALAVLGTSESMAERRNALHILHRKLREAVEKLGTLRTGFEPYQGLEIIRDLHEQTRTDR